MNLIIHSTIAKKIRVELIRSSDKKQKDKGIKTIKTFINSRKNVHNHRIVPKDSPVPGGQIVRTAQKGSPLETLRYPEIGVRVTGSAMFFFNFVVTSSTLPGRTSRVSGVDTSLTVEDLRVAASPT